MSEAVIQRYVAATMKRFGGDCRALHAREHGDGIRFRFNVCGLVSRLDVDLGGNFTTARIRSAFVELGMEMERMRRLKDLRR